MKVFSLANEEEIYVKKETIEGTLVYPGADDYLLAVGVSTFGQDVEFIDDAQIRGGRSKLSPIKGRTHPGAWSFTTYVKPSGSLGVAPEADVLFECLMGKKEVNPGVSVVYSLDSSVNLPSFSLWVKKGHTIFAMAGCTANTGEVSVAGNEIAQVGWSGEFMKWYRAGRALLTQPVATGETHAHVDKAERYSDERIRIKIGDDDNAGAGYTITSVNYSTNVINFTPGLVGAGEAAGAVVQGWWPATGTETGAPVHGKLGICTIQGVPTKVLSARVSITNNIKYYEDEKNGEWYATTYEAIGFRDINGTLSLFYYRGAAGYFYRAEYQKQNALVIPAGSVAGKILEVSCPQIEYRTPALSGDEEILIELPFIAVATAAGDDECSITFR